MQRGQFVLSFLLLLSKRLPCYGSLTATADEAGSGDGLQLSITMGTLGPTSSVPLLTTSEQDRQAAVTSTTKAESAEGEIITTTVSDDMQPAGLHPAVMFGVPAGLLSILLVLLVIFIVRRRNQKQSKQDELGSENCKSPIFEEDTPSVMEIEMEELDKWMNSLKRNAECEYLPPVKEEKDCSANLSVLANQELCGDMHRPASLSAEKVTVNLEVRVTLYGLKEEAHKAKIPGSMDVSLFHLRPSVPTYAPAVTVLNEGNIKSEVEILI